MNIHITPILLLISTAISAQDGDTSKQPLQVISSVDLKRYAGTWYEIARFPNSFQKICVGEVTATYTLRDDGKITVVNRCKKEDGTYTEAEGLAKVASSKGPNTKLKVRFAPAFLSFLWFVWGDYWIIDLAPDYSYAVIGEPDREYLWILSRTPAMSSDVYERILDRLKNQGYDVGRLVRTPQR